MLNSSSLLLLQDSDDEDDMILERRKKKRKLLACLAAINDVVVIGRRPNKKRDEDWARVVDRITTTAAEDPTFFKKMFRLHVLDFWSIFENIKGILANKICSSGIPPLLKFAVTLRWLAGGSYLDLAWGFYLPHNTIHRYFFEVLHAIDCSVHNIQFPLDDMEGLAELEKGEIFSFL